MFKLWVHFQFTHCFEIVRLFSFSLCRWTIQTNDNKHRRNFDISCFELSAYLQNLSIFGWFTIAFGWEFPILKHTTISNQLKNTYTSARNAQSSVFYFEKRRKMSKVNAECHEPVSKVVFFSLNFILCDCSNRRALKLSIYLYTIYNMSVNCDWGVLIWRQETTREIFRTYWIKEMPFYHFKSN